jgi:hypothetical protein
MTKLEAINIILRTLGENPVPNLDIAYPTLNIIIPALDDSRAEVLGEAWWFNTRYNIKLIPDVNGVVHVPLKTLKFYPDDVCITFEGSRFIWKDTGEPVLNKKICGRLVTLLEFEDCPDTCQRLITYNAALATYVTDNGQDASSQQIAQKMIGFAQSLSAEHTRSQRFNSKQKPTVQRWFRNLRT